MLRVVDGHLFASASEAASSNGDGASGTPASSATAADRCAPRVTTGERERMKDLERENRELKRANEILHNASVYFAQAELDRRPR